MRRRDFLAIAALAAAGCRRPPAAGPTTAVPDRIRLAEDARREHLRLLERFRVPAAATRTTPPPPTDLLKLAPELKGLTRVAVRLHPRFGDEPKPTDSKLGGRFAWPADESWPTCDEHGGPLVPVLQLRAGDAPPGVSYRPDTDMLQLFWCPRDHEPAGGPKPTVAWRKVEAGRDLADPPLPELAYPEYVPVPCRVFPERVAEYPPRALLPQETRDRLAGLRVPEMPDEPWIHDLHGPCPGTKVGGYPFGATRADVTACHVCRRPTDFLLAVSSGEWDDELWRRWMPVEERDARGTEGADVGYGRAAGLGLPGSGRVNVFVCRRCDGWPVRTVG